MTTTVDRTAPPVVVIVGIQGPPGPPGPPVSGSGSAVGPGFKIVGTEIRYDIASLSGV